MLVETVSLNRFPFLPRKNDFRDPDRSPWPACSCWCSVREVPGREISCSDMPEGLEESIVDVVEAAVLLLDRKLNTELRFPEYDLYLSSGDDCIALYALEGSSMH
jgi:hypothetical protein